MPTSYSSSASLSGKPHLLFGGIGSRDEYACISVKCSLVFIAKWTVWLRGRSPRQARPKLPPMWMALFALKESTAYLIPLIASTEAISLQSEGIAEALASTGKALTAVHNRTIHIISYMLLASPMSIYDSHIFYSPSKESLVFGRSLGYGMVLFGDKSSYSKTENTLLKSGACSSSLGLQHWFHSSTHCQMRQKASNVYWTKKVFSSFLSSYVVDEQNVVVFKDWVRYRNEVHTVGTKSEASFSDQHIVVQWGVCRMEWRASRMPRYSCDNYRSTNQDKLHSYLNNPPNNPPPEFAFLFLFVDEAADCGVEDDGDGWCNKIFLLAASRLISGSRNGTSTPSLPPNRSTFDSKSTRHLNLRIWSRPGEVEEENTISWGRGCHHDVISLGNAFLSSLPNIRNGSLLSRTRKNNLNSTCPMTWFDRIIPGGCRKNMLILEVIVILAYNSTRHY